LYGEPGATTGSSAARDSNATCVPSADTAGEVAAPAEPLPAAPTDATSVRPGESATADGAVTAAVTEAVNRIPVDARAIRRRTADSPRSDPP
jgi:hypothetical protein